MASVLRKPIALAVATRAGHRLGESRDRAVSAAGTGDAGDPLGLVALVGAIAAQRRNGVHEPTASGSSSTGTNVPDRTVEVCVL